MPTVKKPSAKSNASKKSPAAAKKRATEKKPLATKKAAPKAAPAKSAAKPAKTTAPAKAATKETATSTPPPTPRGRTAAKPAKPEKPEKSVKGAKGARAVVVTAGSDAASKLGTKWNCFRCGAKFYDLNKPEPLCPKCGADQRQRPKVSPAPAAAPAPRKQPRPMAPLLEDEDDGSVRYDEDIDLGVRTELDEPDEELFPPGEFEEDDVFTAPDEE